MPKVKEIKVPVKGLFKGNKKRSTRQQAVGGNVMNLNVGSKRVKFFYQDNGDLAHYASGLIAVKGNTIKAIQLRHAKDKSITNRSACMIAIDELVGKHGADHVLSVMNRAKVINQ